MENQQIQIISPEFIKATRSYITIAKDKDLLDRIRTSSQIDDTLKEAVTKVKSSKHLPSKNVIPEWEMVNGLLWYKGFMCVPNDITLRRDITKRYHDTLSAGHPGENKTLELVSRNYWWPQMGHFIREYVSTCDVCGRIKNRPTLPRPLQPNTIPTRPWQIITADSSLGYQSHTGLTASGCAVIDLPKCLIWCRAMKPSPLRRQRTCSKNIFSVAMAYRNN